MKTPSSGTGSIISAHLENVYHVRLIGSLEGRISHLMHSRSLSGDEARRYIRAEDRERRRYIMERFNCEIDDPLAYNLVVNTDRLGDEAVVEMIAQMVSRESLRPAAPPVANPLNR